jgi:probable Rubsico expression protein CbbX
MADGPPDDGPQLIDLRADVEQTGVAEVLDKLDRELIGLAPVKQRIRETAALLVVERARQTLGLNTEPPTLHMSFTGNPGTGKTTVAMRMADILHRLGYSRRGHLISVTRDDLVGQYIGHTAPKTKEIIKKAMGGVLFIDEAYYLYRPENERDYGQEAIEILLQVMENNRDDLVVILAGYGDRMAKFFESNPGFRSRITHHIDFPDYSDAELMTIAEKMLEQQNFRFDAAARAAFADYIPLRRAQAHFANARSIRNALDRMRLRLAGRVFSEHALVSRDDLMTIRESDVRASRIYAGASSKPAGKPATAPDAIEIPPDRRTTR